VELTETRVDLHTADGVMDTYVFQPPGTGPWPAVIMYMDAMAVRPDLKSMAQRLAAHGYVAVLPNLFYRSGPLAPIDANVFVKPGPERDRVFGLIHSINGPLVMSDTAAVMEYLDTNPSVRGQVGTVGYCMGGGYALRAAGTFPDRVGAAASFHGGWLATDAPDSPHTFAPRIRAKVYIGVAGIDPMFPDQERERLRQALEDAKVDFTLEVYPDVRHGFTVTGHPVYDAAGSERHWQVLLRLFSDTLAA
jgi:carboxymethylenebutenolidase